MGENRGVAYTGTPSTEEIRSSGGYANPERQESGPVAFIECVERIPCNPCETACPYGAITVGDDITALPKLNGDVCIGCGLCIAACPGLAIYVKDFKRGEANVEITFPFEYVPIPSKGDVVSMVDRFGEAVCEGVIVRTNNSRRNDRTAVVTASFERKFFHDVVSIKRVPRGETDASDARTS
jgi:Fe-S-cluster-containing hydrogenase component 2